ncbi:MAG: calcium-binding protein [Devosia sp.]
MPDFPASIDLDDPTEPLVTSLPILGSDDGTLVSVIGDVNGDGIADMLVSVDIAPSYEPSCANYVVFGSATPFPAGFSLDALDGTDGFAIGDRANWRSLAATSAGDLNGDGLVDIAIASANSGDGHLPYADVHVIYGSTDGHGGSLAIDALDGGNGFTLTGPTNDRAVYYNTVGGGDINGDGFDDLVISRNGNISVVLGSDEGFAASAAVLDVAVPAFNQPYREVEFIGDVNGDGFDDLATGSVIHYGSATGSSQYGPFSSRATFVGPLSPDFNHTITAAGDVNGDGVDDYIVGDSAAEPYNHLRAGAAYVVFGREGYSPVSVALSDLDGGNGFVIRGDYGDFLGTQVAGGFDINGDGFDDVVAYSADDDRAYVIYGRETYYTAGFDIADIDGRYGFVIENAGDEWVSLSSISGGDFDGDGIDDLVFGEIPRSIYDDSAIHIVRGLLPTEPVLRRDADGDQTVWGGTGDDTLISYFGDDHLIGGLGNDRLVSAQGTDILDGGLGDDTYVVYRDTADTIIDAGGIDTIEAKTSWSLMDNPEIENLVFSSAGNWLGQGNGLDNIITAGAGNNRLFGDAGNDTLSGGAGDDLLSGGLGRDILSGGIGADRFDFSDFETGIGAQRDVITDFESRDTINLAYMDAKTTRASNQAFAFIADATFSGTAGQLRYAAATGDSGPITLIEGDTNGDGVADFQIELRGTHVLTAGDFIL